MDVDSNNSITACVGDKLCKFFLGYGIFVRRVKTILKTPQAALDGNAIHVFYSKDRDIEDMTQEKFEEYNKVGNLEVGAMNYQFVKIFCNGSVFSGNVTEIQDSSKHSCEINDRMRYLYYLEHLEHWTYTRVASMVYTDSNEEDDNASFVDNNDSKANKDDGGAAVEDNDIEK
eukprot:15103783-Ditylum_brightwellii.AAC.2